MKNENIMIKKMAEKDLDQVAALASQLGYDIKLDDLKFRFYEMISHSDYGLFVASSIDDKVLGWIQVNVESITLLSNVKVVISALIVDEKYRGLKIGTALLRAAENWSKENQFNMISVRTKVARKDAHRFYERSDYTLNKTQHFYIKKL